MAATPVNENIRYEPDEHPPALLTVGAGFQAALLIIGGIVLGVVIVFRIAEQPATYIAWGVFAALLISGITTILQSARLWAPSEPGHILMMGTSGAFFAVCAAALIQGGPALMASLVVVSALFQFALAARLSVLRSIFTPVVSGTVIMLIAATIMPIVFDMLSDAPEGTASAAPPLVAVVTILVVVVLVLRAPASWRLWSPVAGIIVGCAVSAPFGMYDVQYVKDAPWVGVPFDAWPGFDFTPGVEFWALLPAFIVVTFVGAIETIGDGVAIQRVSRRRPGATDYRVVQGALNTDGVGNLLSGLAGTLPNTTYSTSISLAEVTGIAARRVGIVVGVIFIVLAFFPKATALLIAIPSPVAAAYVGILIALLFVQGLRIIVQDGLDHRKATVAGIAFWVGVGFQNGVIFPELLGEGFMGVLLGNGMTSGAIVAVALTAFVELSKPRRRRLRVPLDDDGAPAGGRLPSRLRHPHPLEPRGLRPPGRRRRRDPGHPLPGGGTGRGRLPPAVSPSAPVARETTWSWSSSPPWRAKTSRTASPTSAPSPPCPTTARYPCASSATTHRRSVTRSTTASTS